MTQENSPGNATLHVAAIIVCAAITAYFAAAGFETLPIAAGLPPWGGSAVVETAIMVAISAPAIWYFVVQPHVLARRRSETVLRDVTESIYEGFQLYDDEDRLVICNSKFRQMYSSASHFFVEGRTFEEILRDAVYTGQYPEAAGNEEAWIAKRVHLHRNPGAPIVRRLNNDVWVKIVEARTSMGYTVGIRTDITELKARERLLSENQALLRSILDHSPTSICLKDADGKYLFANKEFAIRNGLNPDAIIGQSTFDVFPPEKAMIMDRLDRAVLESGAPVTREIEVPLADGTQHAILSTKFPVNIPGNDRAGVAFIAMDITELRQREREIAEKTAMLQAVLETVPVLIVALDNEDRITLASRHAADHYGKPAEELTGRMLREILEDRYSEDLDAFLRDIRASRETVRRASHKSSVKPGRIHLSVGSPILSAKGEQLGTLVVVIDVTEHHNAMDQLAQASKLEGIGRLAAGIAHEINTPIQYIGNNLSFLREAGDDMFRIIDAFLSLLQTIDAKGDLSAARKLVEAAIEEADIDYLKEDVPDAIERSEHGIDDVARIVLSLKAFSHPSSAEKTPIDINGALQDTAVISRNEWKHVAELHEDLADDLPEVPGFPGELNQVFLNIIVNAAHAIAEQKNKEPGTITVSSTCQDDGVKVRISDTGPGIPEEIRSRVFEPFFTTKDVGKGTGQGLAISWDIIVNKHGGSIEIETAPGGGTTFVVTLPLATDVEMRAAASG